MTAQLTIHYDLDPNKLSEDIRKITVLSTEVGEVLNDFASGLKAIKQPRKINDYIRTTSNRLAAILERSVNTTYSTNFGTIQASVIVRIIVCAQAMIKNVGLANSVELSRNQEEIRRSYDLFQNLMKQFEETAAEQVQKAI